MNNGAAEFRNVKTNEPKLLSILHSQSEKKIINYCFVFC